MIILERLTFLCNRRLVNKHSSYILFKIVVVDWFYQYLKECDSFFLWRTSRCTYAVQQSQLKGRQTQLNIEVYKQLIAQRATSCPLCN